MLRDQDERWLEDEREEKKGTDLKTIGTMSKSSQRRVQIFGLYNEKKMRSGEDGKGRWCFTS
jgi:hypothetical protein